MTKGEGTMIQVESVGVFLMRENTMFDVQQEGLVVVMSVINDTVS